MKKDEVKKPEECMCCNFETTELTECRANSSRRWSEETGHEINFFCDLCISTMASTAWDYGREPKEILSTICYVGNAILKALKEQVGG